MSFPIQIGKMSIKVQNLRKYGYTDLKHWESNPNNIRVTRKGRLWITHENGEKEIYIFPDSKWGNPFTTKEYGSELCIQLYRKHIIDSKLYLQLQELNGKTLGCFCEQNEMCHINVIMEFIQIYNKNYNSNYNNKIINFVFN